MINIFKKKDKNNNIDYKDSLSEFNSVKNKINSYGYDFDDLDKSFLFIYHLLNKNICTALSVCSYLGINDIPLNILCDVFNLNIEDINKMIDELLPTIRFEAYKLSDNTLDKEYAFFPGVKTNESVDYNDIGIRIDNKFQIKRLIKDLKNKTNNKDIINFFENNDMYVFMLDTLNYKEVLILLYGLGITNDELVEYDDNIFRNIINNKLNDIVDTLNDKIKYMEYMKNYGYDSYDDLLEEYTLILNSVNESKDYINKSSLRK